MQSHLLYEKLQSFHNYSLPKNASTPAVRIIGIEIPPKELLSVVSLLQKHGASLLTLVGVDERKFAFHFSVYLVFCLWSDLTLIEIKLTLDPVAPCFPSITPLVPAAHWLEREARDWLGITPEGHPDLRRLAVHPDWPQKTFPLRKDFTANQKIPRIKGDFAWCSVKGEGIYQVPVGPIHAGIIEPGHFRFFTFGEDVINLQAQLFYTHRGIEKIAEGKHFNHVMLLAERICGACSLSHAVAYAQAIETLAGIEVPKRAQYLRTILLEMERLYNHVGDIGNICAGAGFHYAVSRGGILKERLMRLNRNITGHRYLRGSITPGGVKINLSASKLNYLSTELKRIEKELNDLTKLLLSSYSLLDRMQTTGILSTQAAQDLGAVGPAARASAINRDLRRDLPYGAYAAFDFEIPVQKKGDVFCRFKQRIEESGQTWHILQQALARLPQGDLKVPVPDLLPGQTALGYTESARGANVHWVMSGPDNTVYRYMVRSASHCNWPVLPLCLPGNIIPDFPIINKSFELCYACLDR